MQTLVPKLYLGSAVYRFVETCYLDAMLAFVVHLERSGIPYVNAITRGDAQIDRSRNVIASAFLRSDADVLLTVDSDIWFRPQDAVALCEKAVERDIIGACYVTRGEPTQPAVMLPPGEVVMFMPGVSPVEVPFLSTGFMAVHRRVFEKLSESVPRAHQNWRGPGGDDQSWWMFYTPFSIEWPGDVNLALSEDWAFCQRARDAGFKVWLDPSIRVGHNGDRLLTLEEMLRPPRPAPGPLALKRDLNGVVSAGQLQRHAVPAGLVLPNGKSISDLAARQAVSGR